MGTNTTVERHAKIGLRSYAVRLRGSAHETIVNHSSPGRAKRQFLADLDIDGVTFTDIRIRRLGPPATTAGIKRVAEHRGVPFAAAGMLVEVGEDRGRIVGHNSSGNFDVLFETGKHANQVLNCHPLWEIAYFDGSGNVLADFRCASQASGLRPQASQGQS